MSVCQHQTSALSYQSTPTSMRLKKRPHGSPGRNKSEKRDTEKVHVAMASAGCEWGPDPWDGDIWDDNDRDTDCNHGENQALSDGATLSSRAPPSRREKRYSKDSEIPPKEMFRVQDAALNKVLKEVDSECTATAAAVSEIVPEDRWE